MKYSFSLPLIFFLIFSGCSKSGSGSEKDFSVALMMGRYLWSQEGRTVVMVGVHIPTKQEPNHHEVSYETFKQLLTAKQVKVRVVEKKHSVGYPYFDLVEVYLEDLNVNKYLLEQGLAFFNEDHWNNKEKKRYRELEAQAQQKKLGLWSNPKSLKVLFIRPNNGRFVHYPGCPHVKDLKLEERVEYFSPVPRTPFMAIRNAFFCDYCRPRFEGDFAELEKKIKKTKVRLES